MGDWTDDDEQEFEGWYSRQRLWDIAYIDAAKWATEREREVGHQASLRIDELLEQIEGIRREIDPVIAELRDTEGYSATSYLMDQWADRLERALGGEDG